MRISFLLGLFFLNSSIGFSQIDFFQGTWNEVVAEARKQGKPIVVDAYTTWCGPCKWMDKNTFQNLNVGAFVNEKFVAYKMDMEKGEGIDFAKRNKVEAYPTILFFDEKGEPLHRNVGALDTTQFVSLCKDALDPSKQLGTLKKRFESGDHSPEFVIKYLKALDQGMSSDRAAFDVYWNSLTADQKLSEDAFGIMMGYTERFSNKDNEQVKFFLTHRNDYKKSLNGSLYQYALNSLFSASVNNAVKMANDADAKKELEAVKAMLPEKANETDAYYNWIMAYKQNDTIAIEKAKVDYLKVTTDHQRLNSAAWGIYENSNSKKELKQGLNYINRSIDVLPEYNNLDTKAAILFKMKKYDEALTFADKAIHEGEKIEGMDITSSLDLKKQIIAKLAK
jgi:thiol-disulfide isomerase/thioredoxin